MHLFIDESECRKSQRYYVGGLLCSEGQAEQIAQDLLALAKDCECLLGLSAEEIEFHGYEICHAAKQWEPMAEQVLDRIDIYLRATRTVGSYGTSFFIKPVRQNMLAIRGDHEMALLYLLEEVDRQCETMGLEKGSIQVVCDKINIQTKIQNSYLLARNNGTGGWKSRKLEWLANRLSFLDSREHRLIQAVDILLFAHCRTHYFEHQIADGVLLSKNKRRELKALKKIRSSFSSVTQQLPIFEPPPFRT
jgi:hypothetical protein